VPVLNPARVESTPPVLQDNPAAHPGADEGDHAGPQGPEDPQGVPPGVPLARRAEGALHDQRLQGRGIHT